MKDRIVEFPNRHKIIPVPGQADTVDLVPAPGVVAEEGTRMNKANLFTDETAALYGLEGEAATVNNALAESVAKVGDIRTFGRELNDPKWIPCNGQWVSRAQYPLLSDIISSTYLKNTPLDIINEFGASGGMQAIIHAKGLFVGVGNSGVLVTSPDGRNWTERTSGFGSSQITDIAFGNDVFVIVGADGKIASSTNGTTWTMRTNPLGNTHMYTIAFGAGRFIAAGGTFYGITSTDGITWEGDVNIVTGSPYSRRIDKISFGNGVFIAVHGPSTSNPRALTRSFNGIDWAVIPMPDMVDRNNIYSLIYVRSRWYLTGRHLTGGNGGIWESINNGTSWVKSTMPINEGANVQVRVLGDYDGMFVATRGGSGSNSMFVYSYDLVEWLTQGTLPNAWAAAFNAGTWIFIAGGGSALYSLFRPADMFVVPSYNQDLPYAYIKGAR